MTNLFEIDQTKCKGDGICAASCPVGIIIMRRNIPTLLPNAEARCINCGHCVSVCPHAALSLNKMPIAQCAPIKSELESSADQVEQLLKSRRSIRIYKPEPIQKDVLTNLIDTARYGPTGTNAQPVHWTVIYEAEKVKHLAETVIDWMRGMKNDPVSHPMASYFEPLIIAWDKGKDAVCRSAPHLVIASSSDAQRSGSMDCTIALTYFSLAALPYGIGTCWAGIVQIAAAMSPTVNKALNLPQGHRCQGAMMVGYPRYQYHRIPLRNEAPVQWV